MALHADLDNDIPIPDKDDTTGQKDLVLTARAATNAAKLLAEHGLEVGPSDEDVRLAAALATEYAKDPETTSAAATPARMAHATPAALIMVSDILDRFGHAIVKDSVQVRHMVTNKLIEETENADPRIRLRALELLGKITDVGLFTERSEVTVTHQTSEDLKDRLRSKLQKLKDVTPTHDVEDAEIVNE